MYGNYNYKLPGRAALSSLSALPAGQVIRVQMNDEITSATARVGDRFATTVISPVYANGVEVIPAGSTVMGQVTSVDRASNSSNPGTVGVNFFSLRLTDGLESGIDGDLTDLSDESGAAEGLTWDLAEDSSSPDEEQAKVIKSSPKRNVRFIGGGASKGALIGAIAGGGKGTMSGASTSAAIGLPTPLLLNANEARISPGTEFGVVVNQILMRRSTAIKPPSISVPVISSKPKRVIPARPSEKPATAGAGLRKTTKAVRESVKVSLRATDDKQQLSGESKEPQNKEPVSEEEKKQIVANLLTGKLVHKIPKEMQVEVGETVEIRVTQTATDEDLTEGLAGRGPLQRSEIPVGKVMIVYLKPHDQTAFNITLTNRTTERQKLEGKKYVTWIYRVQPLKSGPQGLSVIAVVPHSAVGSGDDPDEFVVYNEQIQVRVNASNFFVQNWQFIVTGIWTLLTAFVAYRFGRTKTNNKKQDPVPVPETPVLETPEAENHSQLPATSD